MTIRDDVWRETSILLADLLRGYFLSPDVRLSAPEGRPANRPAKTKQHRVDGIGGPETIWQYGPYRQTVSHFDQDTLLFTVTGILKDVPGNSQLQFDALQTLNTIYKPEWMTRGHGVTTYLELAPNTNVAALEKKFPGYLKKYRMFGDQNLNYELFLLPLKDIHANAVDISDENVNFQKFDRRYTYILIVIGLLVLLIACINFMNLSTARSAERGKEVGIRKSIAPRARNWVSSSLVNRFCFP